MGKCLFLENGDLFWYLMYCYKVRDNRRWGIWGWKDLGFKVVGILRSLGIFNRSE